MDNKTSLTHQNIIAVGIGSSPNSAHLARWTKEKAEALRASWVAIHIDDGSKMDRADKERLESNLEIAKGFGAEVITLVNADVVSGIIGAAFNVGATLLVIGRSGLSNLSFLPHRATLADHILREAKTLDVIVVSDANGRNKGNALASFRHLLSAPFGQYVVLFATFIFVTALTWLLAPLIGNRSIALIYLATILLLSLIANPVSIVILAILSSLSYNYFFIPPRFTFAITSLEDVLLFCLYFLVAAVTGSLSAGLRSRERLLVQRDKAANLLLQASEQLSIQSSTLQAANIIAQLIERHSGNEALVYINSEGTDSERIFGSGKTQMFQDEWEAINACTEKGIACGKSTPRFSQAAFRFIPVAAGKEPVGAIGYRVSSNQRKLQENDQLYIALGKSLALFVAREKSEIATRKAALELESNRLAKVLFDSAAHELKTPLTMITGSLSALQEESLLSNTGIRQELLKDALQYAEKLNKVVEDFLSISRIDSGTLKLKRETIEASEIARAAASLSSAELQGRELRIVLPDDPVLFSLDVMLVARLTSNLLENAAHYSRKAEMIELRIERKEGGLSIIVKDSGPGFSPERMQAPFSKFLRTKGDKPGGIGLGLAICRGIAEAHGGRIDARKDKDGFYVEAIFPSCEIVGE
jgi:two-component system sensor histidine kinase KdpD